MARGTVFRMNNAEVWLYAAAAITTASGLDDAAKDDVVRSDDACLLHR